MIVQEHVSSDITLLTRVDILFNLSENAEPMLLKKEIVW